MLERKNLTELRADLEAALASDDVPSLATAAAELRAQLARRRAADGDAQDVEAIDELRTSANQALARRLDADVESAAATEITIPDDYRAFADELATDEPRFLSLAARAREVFADKLVAGAAGSEEGD
jgi:hypothetical protein